MSEKCAVAEVDLSGGYVRLYRKLVRLGSEFVGDLPLLGTWIHMMLRATWVDREVDSKHGKLTLRKGQLCIGTREFADHIGITRQQLRRTIRDLANAQRITQQTTHQGTIITILNFDTYQPTFFETTQLRTNMRTEENQERTTNNELKENNNIKNISSPKVDRCSKFDHDLADQWFAWAKTQLHTIQPTRDGAETIRKLREIDNLTETDLNALFQFVKKDDFWSSNALSPSGLRAKGKNGLRKFENIQRAMVVRPIHQHEQLRMFTPEELGMG